ncbi:MAG: hypothetical protein ABSC94_27150 [Polyangiaceae bacterium]|jgi:hypothetical protein
MAASGAVNGAPAIGQVDSGFESGDQVRDRASVWEDLFAAKNESIETGNEIVAGDACGNAKEVPL